MIITAQIVNAFVDEGKGGNPAGVVLDADNLTADQKLVIAKKIGHSETAFVSESAIADFKLDFFTPVRQIAHCGHATIATFSLLKQLGRIKNSDTSKETLDGRREIYIEQDMAFMEQLAPKYKNLRELELPVDFILKSMRLSAADLLPGCPPVLANTGNSFLIVPLKNEASVIKAAPDLKAIEEISENLDLIGFYIFSLDTRVAGRDAGTRMFAPRYGISEEPATGMAAGPLACFLHDQMQIRKENFIIEQGHLMNPPSPSAITVNLKTTEGRIERLAAGGKARIAETLQIAL